MLTFNPEFLHASLQLEVLCCCPVEAEAINTLEAFPPNVEEAYLITWRQIAGQPQNHFELAKQMLLWATYASIGLRIEALRCLVATSPDRKRECILNIAQIVL